MKLCLSVCVAGQMLIAGWPLPACAAEAPKPAASSADADAAWENLQKAQVPPPEPESWKGQTPSNEEQAAFFLPVIHKTIDAAADFHGKFPSDSREGKARIIEFQFLGLEKHFGEEPAEARLEAVKQGLLKDPSITGDEHFKVVMMVAESSSPEKARPLYEEVAKGAAPEQFKDAAAAELKKLDALGKPVDLKFAAVDGRAVDLSALKGKVVLVDFWATWCGPCVGEVPKVVKTYNQYHAKGFEIVGISLDKAKAALTGFTAEHQMEWPQYFDGQGWKNKFAQQFGINSIPAMWLVDKKGILRNEKARDDLDGNVAKLMAE